MSEKTPLGELPIPSTEKTSDVDLHETGGALTLSFTFNRDGVRYRSGVRFDKVRAHRWRAEGHCTAWHIDGVYDTVAEVKESDWAKELAESESEKTRVLWHWVMRHFMLYVDSDGCFEVVAESWALLPEEPTGESDPV